MSTADEPTTGDTPEGVESTAAEPESAVAEMPVETVTRRALAVLRSQLRRALIAHGIALVYTAAFILAGGLGWQLWQQHQLAAAGAAGQRAAVDYARVLTSIDSNTVDDDFAAVLNGATGEFKETYTKASVQLRQLLIDNRATAQGTVVDSAVQSEARDKVVVLLMVDQKITNTARPDPRIDHSRMKMTVQKVDGRWLASKVELP